MGPYPSGLPSGAQQNILGIWALDFGSRTELTRKQTGHRPEGTGHASLSPGQDITVPSRHPSWRGNMTAEAFVLLQTRPSGGRGGWRVCRTMWKVYRMGAALSCHKMSQGVPGHS